MSLGFAQWATGVRNRMASDPGRADFKDQVQCHGYLFLHEYLDDVLNVPRPDNLIEFTKTPGRNKTAKKARTITASAQKLKPVAPISFEPTDKENDSSAPAPKPPQFKATRPQPIPTSDAAPTHPRDSISRATPVRPGVPIFSPANKTPGSQAALPTPSDDPLSPFRDAPSPDKDQPKNGFPADQIFTTKLTIQPSSPAPEEAPLPEPTKQPSMSETQPTEADLSVIQEDDEGQSFGTFEDAREEFTHSRAATDTEQEADITDAAITLAQPEPAPRLPSPPASEPTPAPSSKPATPIKAPEHEPTEPITSANVLLTDVLDAAPVPAPEPVPVPVPVQVTKPASISQPTPPPEPSVPPTPLRTSRPLPVPPSRTNSGTGTAQVKPVSTTSVPVPPPQPQPVPVQLTTAPVSAPAPVPAPNPRTSAVPRGPFAGPSLKELRREPSVSGVGQANRELRQSSWRKKPDGTTATSTSTTASTSTDAEPQRLKRKSSALQLPRPAPKSQKLSRHSSPTPSNSSEEETELQVPLKDEDSGSGWNSGTGSMLDDLRNRLARLEKSTSGKTPAASRVWTPSMASTSLPSEREKRLSLSDLSVRPAPTTTTTTQEQDPEKEREGIVGLDLGLGVSTDNPAASILSNRTTTPDNSPPPVRRVLPAPPVFALPEPVPAPAPAKSKTSAESSKTAASADAVRANAKAEAARLFGGTKFTAPPPAPAPARTETQTTASTDVDSVFDMRSQSQSQWTQSTAMTSQSQSVFGAQTQSQEEEDIDIDLDDELDAELDLDVDVEGDDDEVGEDDGKTSGTSSLASSTTQTRAMAKKGPVKSIQLAAAAAKKAAEEQDRKATRMREMEERRQAAALRKAEEDKSRTLELEKKRKEREDLAASKGVKPPVKKVAEDPNKKRKVEPEKKAEVKKPAAPSALGQSAAPAASSSTTKSRIAKPTATAGPSGLKPALKSTQNPFSAAQPASAAKTLKPSASSSSLKSTAAKKAKGSISDAPGRALQEQMQARVQAQMKAAQKEPEVQSENIELPDINSEYSDSDDEDRGKDFPEWTQQDELMQALRDQETFNPDAIFGPIQPLKMGDLFKTGHSRFRKRTSSANWAGTDGITVEEEIEYARRMGYTNQ